MIGPRQRIIKLRGGSMRARIRLADGVSSEGVIAKTTDEELLVIVSGLGPMEFRYDSGDWISREGHSALLFATGGD
jgi:hypothetical protein